MSLFAQLSLAALGGAALGGIFGFILAAHMAATREREQLELVKRIQLAMAKGRA